jgi:two-component system NtrC family sensor kinase
MHLDSVVELLIPLLLGHQLDAIYDNLTSLKRRNKDWISIQLFTADGKMIYPLHSSQLPAAGVMQHTHIFEKPINYLDVNLGKLILVEDYGPRLTAVWKRHRELMISLLTIIGAFFLTVWLTIERIVSRPVKRLASASRRLADGDFNVPLLKMGRDEIGTLVESFSDMRDAIHGYQEELIQKNESLIKLSLAIEQSPVSIMITDAAGDIEFTNPKFSEVTGYAGKEVIGKNPRFLKSGDTPREAYKTLWAGISSGNVWHGEFHNRKKNGELFWESASISPVRNTEGIITHYIAVKEDITERKKLEEQLRQSQKLEAIGQLAGGIAHDFNNMLTAIIGYAHLLAMKIEKGSETRLYLDQILSSAEKSANLTRQLLAFSRKQIIAPEETDLNALIKKMEKLLLRLISEDIELKTELAYTDLTVMVDPGQIEQVLMNLCTNARDAMPHGGMLAIGTDVVELDEACLKTQELPGPGKYAILSVTDTGMGMDEKTRQRIFEPFFTTKEMGKGTGLGLSIVYGIIKQHNGNITVYSEPGKGTTFKIYLPLVKSRNENEEAVEVVPPRGNAETILIAEDNEEVRVLTKNVLEEYGYRVIEAVDGEDAVTKFIDNKDMIRLVMIDVIMPKKSGKEAVNEIKKTKPDVKVLFASGYTVDIINKKGILEEGIDFISKPVTPRDLLVKIRQVLDKISQTG